MIISFLYHDNNLVISYYKETSIYETGFIQFRDESIESLLERINKDGCPLTLDQLKIALIKLKLNDNQKIEIDYNHPTIDNPKESIK